MTNPAGDKTLTVLTPFGATDYVVTGPVVSATTGDKTDYTYDPAGQFTVVDEAGTGQQAYSYWDTGEVRTYTAEGGATTVTNYDDAGRLQSEVDGAGRKTSYGYDTSGRLWTVRQPGGTCTGAKSGCITYSYDDAGRQTGVDYSDATPDVTAIGYDGAGHRTSLAAPGVGGYMNRTDC